MNLGVVFTLKLYHTVEFSTQTSDLASYVSFLLNVTLSIEREVIRSNSLGVMPVLNL